MNLIWEISPHKSTSVWVSFWSSSPETVAMTMAQALLCIPLFSPYNHISSLNPSMSNDPGKFLLQRLLLGHFDFITSADN